MGERDTMTLAELQEIIKRGVEGALPGKYWIKAETGEVKVNSSGHCYTDLIDKDKKGLVNARLSAVIWSSSYRVLRPYFESTTGAKFQRGISVLVCVVVQYSSIYGLTLVITDIDPSFTVGEYELKRQQTIAKLKEEGMIELNKSIPLDPLPGRVAVISSETAAGYRDFIKHINSNDYGFQLIVELFPAPMQGESAPSGIIEAMDRVALAADSFDMLIIIRGGGSAMDLSCFDDYELALNIAQFPLPVITGIGHDHDFHVADMVAHTSVKTPTAAADFLIDIFAREEQQLTFLSRRVSLSLLNRSEKETARIEGLRERIGAIISNRLIKAQHLLEIAERRIELANPLSILDKGFAIPMKGKKRLRRVGELGEGDTITLIMTDGKAECIIKEIENEKD